MGPGPRRLEPGGPTSKVFRSLLISAVPGSRLGPRDWGATIRESHAGLSTGPAGPAFQRPGPSITDCSMTDDGWFLDDVAVAACVP